LLEEVGIQNYGQLQAHSAEKIPEEGGGAD
jgi:hypothetical protein